MVILYYSWYFFGKNRVGKKFFVFNYLGVFFLIIYIVILDIVIFEREIVDENVLNEDIYLKMLFFKFLKIYFVNGNFFILLLYLILFGVFLDVDFLF